MAASNALSSAGWVINFQHFKATLEAGFVERSNMDTFIHPDYADRVFRGLKQFFYWTGKFKDRNKDTILTFSMMGPNGLVKPDIKAIHQIITSKLGQGNIKNINYTQNANFVSLVLSSSEVAKTVRQEVVEIDGALVCYISSLLPGSYQVKILWSPLFCPIENIAASLKFWCKEVSLKYEDDHFHNGESISTNRVSGLITLKDEFSLQQFPHIIKLAGMNNQYVLVIIGGRDPMCLKCRLVGHIRKYCPNVKCAKCKLYHDINGSCPPRTYASIASTNPYKVMHKDSLESCSSINSLDRICLAATLNEPSPTQLPDLEHEKDDSKHLLSTEDLDYNISVEMGREGMIVDTQKEWIEVKSSSERKGSRLGIFKVNQNVGSDRLESFSLNNTFSILNSVTEWDQSDTVMDENTVSCLEDSHATLNKDSVDSLHKHQKRPGSYISSKVEKKSKGEAGDRRSMLEVGVLTRSSAKSVIDRDPVKALAERVATDVPEATDIDRVTSCQVLDENHKVLLNNMALADKSSENLSDSFGDESNPHGVCCDPESDFSLMNDVRLLGFNIATPRSVVFEFLGSPQPLEVWKNLNENGEFDGAFGATYNTPEEAKVVFDRKKQKFKGKTIIFSRFA